MAIPYSGSVTVFPLNTVSFVADRSVANPSDATIHVNAFNNDVQTVDVVDWVSGPKQVYLLTQPPTNGDGIYQYKINVGSVDFAIVRDDNASIFILQAFVHVPIVGALLVANAVGYIKDGVSISLNLPPILTGDASLALDGNCALLVYNFKDISGNTYQATVPVY